jgi:hypothetical protein
LLGGVIDKITVIACVAKGVGVAICLIRIERRDTVVAKVSNIVDISVFLCRVGDAGTVVNWALIRGVAWIT